MGNLPRRIALGVDSGPASGCAATGDERGLMRTSCPIHLVLRSRSGSPPGAQVIQSARQASMADRSGLRARTWAPPGSEPTSGPQAYPAFPDFCVTARWCTPARRSPPYGETLGPVSFARSVDLTSIASWPNHHRQDERQRKQHGSTAHRSPSARTESRIHDRYEAHRSPFDDDECERTRPLTTVDQRLSVDSRFMRSMRYCQSISAFRHRDGYRHYSIDILLFQADRENDNPRATCPRGFVEQWGFVVSGSAGRSRVQRRIVTGRPLRC